MQSYSGALTAQHSSGVDCRGLGKLISSPHSTPLKFLSQFIKLPSGVTGGLYDVVHVLYLFKMISPFTL